VNAVAGHRVWLETEQSTSIRPAVFYMPEHGCMATTVVEEHLCCTLSG